MSIIDFSNYPFEKRDLTNSDQNAKVLEIASQIYQSCPNIISLENELFLDSKFVRETSPVLLEAIKCAASKHNLKTTDENIHLSVVFAMYSETARLSTKEENVHGEDCLREKVRQLDWLKEGLEQKFSYDIIAVDDGCELMPSSYDKAKSIVESEDYKNIRIIKIKDAINSLAVCTGFTDLEKTSDSRKGGAIALGLWEAQNAVLAANKEHILIYTDADLSSNLGQSGTLIKPIVNENKIAAIAHRYGINKAVLVKEKETTTEPDSTKCQPGKLIILLRHFARVSMLPLLEHIQDSQAGFKAFKAKDLKKVLLYMEFMNETFDVELLLRILSSYGKSSVVSVPILFTEDLAMSNFPANSVNKGHLNMFKQIVHIYDKIGYRFHSINNETLRFWRRLKYEDLNQLIQFFSQNPPEDLDELLFNFRWSMSDLREIIQKV